MPLVCGWVVIDSHRRAKAGAAVGTVREHHVCAVVVAWGPDTAQHVNVVVGGSARTVHCQEYLRCQPSWIYVPANPHATKIDLSDLLKDRRLTTELRVTRANTPKLATD